MRGSRMRPVVKVENGVGRALAVEGLQPEADAGRPWLRRRLSEAGAAVSDEALSRRAFLEADALAVEGMERTRVLGEELLQAQALIAKLEAEARIQVAIIQSKDEQLQQAKVTQLAAAAAAADYVFQEGQRLYGEQRYSDAAQRWGQAALLQHAPSHACLSNMLNDGKPGVGKDGKRAFELAAAGVVLGCAHSKGALGRCYVFALGVAEDAAVHCERAGAGKGERGGGQLLRAVRGWELLLLWCRCCAGQSGGCATLAPCSGTGACRCSVRLQRHVSQG